MQSYYSQFCKPKELPAAESAAGSTKFPESIRVILSQTEKGLEFVHAVSGAGFDICADIGKVTGIGFAQELPGHFVLALYEAKGTLAEVVGRRDGEVPDPFRIVLLELPVPD